MTMSVYQEPLNSKDILFKEILIAKTARDLIFSGLILFFVLVNWSLIRKL